MKTATHYSTRETLHSSSGATKSSCYYTSIPFLGKYKMSFFVIEAHEFFFFFHTWIISCMSERHIVKLESVYAY